MKIKKNISIFYLTIGSGHQIAAEGLAEFLNSANDQINAITSDPFAESIDILPSILEKAQTVSITITPKLYDSAWRSTKTASVFEKIKELDLLKEMMLKEVKKHKSKTIISTHVVPTIISLALKNDLLIERAYGIVTDYGLHSYWPENGLDGLFVAHQELRNILIFRGFDPKSIHVTGIPLRNEFENSSLYPPKNNKSLLRVLIIVGGVRRGSYHTVQQYICNFLEVLSGRNLKNVELTVITGKQSGIYDKLTNYINRVSFKLKVLKFTDKMGNLLRSHDILITKPGGLIISEAIASGNCLIIFHAGPGQEKENANFLARHGVAFWGESPEKIADILQRLSLTPAEVQSMKSRIQKLSFPSSSSLIAQKISRDLSQKNEFTS